MPPAGNDPDPLVDKSSANANIFETRFNRHRLAFRVFGARGRKPGVAITDPTFHAADFARASRPRLGQSDRLLHICFGCRGKFAALIEAGRAVLFLDLKHLEWSAILERNLDPVASTLQEIRPTICTVGIALRCVSARGWMKQAWMRVDQVDAPVLHRVGHCIARIAPTLRVF